LKHRIAASTLLGVTLLIGCGGGSGYVLTDFAPPSSPAYAGTNFDGLVTDYLDFYYRTYPPEGTWSGYHRYDGGLFDFRQTSIQKTVVTFQRFANVLKAIPTRELSPEQQLDAEILKRHIETQIFELNDQRSWATNPLAYDDEAIFSLDELVQADFAPLESRLKNIVSRLQQLPALYQAALANLKSPPRELVEVVLQDSNTKLAFFSDYLPDAVRTAQDAALLGRFRKANEKAYTEAREFYGYLNDQVLPRAEGTFALGYDRFATLLRLREMVDTPLEQLQALGDQELLAAQGRFLESVSKLGAGLSVSDALQQLREDHGAPETLLDDVATTADRLKQFISRNRLVDVSNAETLRVVEMPPYLFGFAWAHLPGPFEKAASGASLYVQPIDTSGGQEEIEKQLQEFPRPRMVLTTMHEAFPGHFLQNSKLLQCSSRVRKAFRSYAFTAGWAHYGEQLMIESGYADNDPRVRVAHAHDDLLRACRFVCAIKMHTQGMTVEEASEFFVKEGYQDENTAKHEAVRGTYDPLYLDYTLGKMMFLKLRDDVKRARGASFDLRAFHEEVLTSGAPPIPILRRLLLPGDRESPLPAPPRNDGGTR
jgi:uncharacterized protein (DUF885 family)